MFDPAKHMDMSVAQLIEYAEKLRKHLADVNRFTRFCINAHPTLAKLANGHHLLVPITGGGWACVNIERDVDVEDGLHLLLRPVYMHNEHDDIIHTFSLSEKGGKLWFYDEVNGLRVELSCDIGSPEACGRAICEYMEEMAPGRTDT